MELEQIKQLYKAMDDNNFTELDLSINGNAKIKLKLDAHRGSATVSPMPVLENILDNGNLKVEDTNLENVLAEKVGVFKSNEKIKVGTKVKVGDLLGTIVGISFEEQVKARVSGTIESVIIGANEIVDYGKLLFTIHTGEI